MSSIVKQKVGNHTYLYESVSYRNEEGKPRNRRTTIGKLDPRTGNPIYKPEYLKRMADSGRIVELPQLSDETFSAEDIQQSSIQEIGAFHMYRELSARLGLLPVLKEAIPQHWEEIFTLAAYLVTSGDPFAYCEDWLSDTEAFDVGKMTSQRISELMKAITPQERDRFYSLWCSLRSELEYLALDITSVSSYSEFIDSVEWGYNRDKERLAQINLCMLMGYKSRLPIYQSVYSGSLKDVSTLQKTIQTFHALTGDAPIVAIMDKGFYSDRNINAMLSCQNTEFLIAVPFTSKFSLSQVENERDGIDTLANTIVAGSDSMRAVTRLRQWNAKHQLYTHIFYNAKKANGIKESLYSHVSLLKECAELDPEKCASDPKYTKYLHICVSGLLPDGYTVELREDVVAAELKTAGWMVLVSNRIEDAKEAIRIYREKDIVEKGFQRLKNCLDLGRLRVHSEESMQNKVFVGFIALILLSSIHQVMVDKNLYAKMTMKRLLITLSKVKVQKIRGLRLLFPLTKEQRLIFEAFDVKPPL